MGLTGLFSTSNKKVINKENTRELKIKPAAHAAGADPSQCNSTSRQNPLIQQNCLNC